MPPTSPDSQVVLGGLDEIRDIAAISTEPCHKWWILWTSIPHFNVVRWCSLAINIHWEEGYFDIGPNGLRYEVDTVYQIWVVIWVQRWGEDSTCIWIVSPTFFEKLQGLVLYLKSISISSQTWVKSEIESINGNVHLLYIRNIPSPHPQLVLAWLNRCRDCIATQFFEEWRMSRRPISDL